MDGPTLRRYTSAFGLSWAMAHGKIATRMNRTRITVPAVALWLERMARPTPPTAAGRRRPPPVGSAATRAASGAPASSGPTGARIIAIGSPRRPGPRVEQRGGDVRQQDGHQHGHRDQQEQGLHERVVLVLDRLQQHVADPGVVEDVLDEDGAADDEAERHREAGEIGNYP